MKSVLIFGAGLVTGWLCSALLSALHEEIMLEEELTFGPLEEYGTLNPQLEIVPGEEWGSA